MANAFPLSYARTVERAVGFEPTSFVGCPAHLDKASVAMLKLG